jgi:cytidylate kinase
MVITIDGPAGAGKSTIARAVAKRLGYAFQDTGAMYRACTWAALKAGVAMDDPPAIVALVRRIKLELEDDGETQHVRVDGKDVTQEIRSEAMARHIFRVADPPEVRRELVRLQRAHAEGKNIVSEGRDQGTVVFPDAKFKFYLDASLEERVQRRMAEMQARHLPVAIARLRADMAERDERDRSRQVGAMRAAADAVVIDTTGMTVEQAVEAVVKRIQGGG